MSSQPTTPLGMAAYRSPSLFQPHRARQALRDANSGKIPPLIGLYLGLSTVATARFVAPMGYDMIWVDWEHSSCGVETMTTMVHEIMFMSEGKTIPFVRYVPTFQYMAFLTDQLLSISFPPHVPFPLPSPAYLNSFTNLVLILLSVPGHDHAAIGYALDAGASVVIPQVETVAQAQHVLSSSKFGTHSRGTRSAPPFRLIPGVTDICHDAKNPLGIHGNLNDAAAVMIQIETLEGIRNLDSILTEVPGIDAVWLGTLDLRVSMNLPGNGGMGGAEPEWLDAVKLYDDIMARHLGVAKAGFALAAMPNFEQMAHGKALVVMAADVMAFMSLMASLQSGREVVKPLENGVKGGVEKKNGVVNGSGNGLVVNGNGKA
ncbi:hypothetical protein MMC27_006857 [Xylographa pallens]|nr:hypothetical protein [Xylographa pallens]